MASTNRPVAEDYAGNSRFTGKIVKVTVDIADPKLSIQDKQAIEQAGKTAAAVKV